MRSLALVVAACEAADLLSQPGGAARLFQAPPRSPVERFGGPKPSAEAALRGHPQTHLLGPSAAASSLDGRAAAPRMSAYSLTRSAAAWLPALLGAAPLVAVRAGYLCEN